MMSVLTQLRRMCRRCGASLTDQATPVWCSYCHTMLEPTDILEKARTIKARTESSNIPRQTVSSRPDEHKQHKTLEDRAEDLLDRFMRSLTRPIFTKASAPRRRPNFAKSGVDLGMVYAAGAYITGTITFFACWIYSIA